MPFLLLNILAALLYVSLPHFIGDLFWAKAVTFSAFGWFFHMMALTLYFLLSDAGKGNEEALPLMKTAFWAGFLVVLSGIIAMWVHVPDW